MLLDVVVDARLGHKHPHPTARVAAAAGTRLAGMRLLVAEDKLNNQQVARELLEDEGAEVQIAANGQIAVEAVAAADLPFDAVLMDLQMPVMDGFGATARIRQDLLQTSLPIVAMTANAMASDREACLAAGMNEHLGKPFDLNHLVQVLRRVAGPDTGGAAPAIGAAASPAAGSAEFGPDVSTAAATAGVQLAPALRRLGGKVPVYERMLRHFVKDLVDMEASLASGLQAQDVLTAMAGVRPALAALQAAPGSTLMVRVTVPTPAPAMAAPTGASLKERITLLENADMRATAVMAKLQQQCAGSPALRELEAAVSGLDFETEP